MAEQHDDPTRFNEPQRKTLIDADAAGLGQAVLTLTHELYILLDRVSVLEAVIEEAGIEVSDKIEHFTPDAALQKKMDERGRALVARVAAALSNHAPSATDKP